MFVYGNTRLEAPSVENNPTQTYDKETSTSTAIVSKYKVLESIAKCEGGTQYNEDGTLVRGKVNPKDVGKFQINEKYHLANAQSMDINIYTLEGNTKYAEYLYETQGAKPWSASAKCHGYY